MRLVVEQGSQGCRAVRWFAEYLEKDVEVVDKAEDADFMKGNPFGEVPVLVGEEGVRVRQCNAIMEFLGEGEALPMPIQVDEYVGVHYSVVRNLTLECFTPIIKAPPSERDEVAKSCGAAVASILTRLEDTLAKQRYIAGSELTFADFLLTCELDQLAPYGLLEGYLGMRSYLKKMAEIKHYEKYLEKFNEEVQQKTEEAAGTPPVAPEDVVVQEEGEKQEEEKKPEEKQEEEKPEEQQEEEKQPEEEGTRGTEEK